MKDTCSVCDKPFKRVHPHQNLCVDCVKESQRAIKELPEEAVQSILDGIDKDMLHHIAQKCVLVSLTNVGVAKAMETSVLNIETGQTSGAILMAVNNVFFQKVVWPMLESYYRQARNRNQEGEEWKYGRETGE